MVNIPIYNISYIKESDLKEYMGHWGWEIYSLMDEQSGYNILDCSEERMSDLMDYSQFLFLKSRSLFEDKVFKMVELEIELIHNLNLMGYNETVLVYCDY